MATMGGKKAGTGTRKAHETTPRRGRGSSEPIRYAVVGLGHIAQIAVLPAFGHAKKDARLVALVSDDDEKLRELGERYGVPEERRVGYESYDELLASGEVDAVYIALPNSMHREYTERAAACGVHVLCEKPLAVTAEDCRAMIAAAKEAGVHLMTAYRLHFEKATLRAVELARGGALGDLRYFSSTFSMQVREGDIRTQRELGGGALYDIGIYCINAARMIFAAEPIRVHALAVRDENDPRFAEIATTLACTLTFPGDRTAQFTVSFGASDVSEYRVVGTGGSLRVEPAYEYAEGLEHYLTVDGKEKHTKFDKRDQFAPELVYFADCIREGRAPETGGEEGLLDVRIIEALERSARTGETIDLEPYEAGKYVDPSQRIDRPAVDAPPKTVNATSPSV